MQSSDEDSDDMPVALSQRARQQSGRSHASRADGSNLSRAKTLNSHTPSNYQSNLARRNTEHQRGREAVTGTVEPSQNRSDSDNDGHRRGRSAMRATRNHATDVCLQALCNFKIIITQFLTTLFTLLQKLGKSGQHDVRSVQSDLHKLQLAAVHKVASRIYINDSSRYISLQLTSLMTTAMVIELLRERSLIDHEQSWTLFELANRLGVGKLYEFIFISYL